MSPLLVLQNLAHNSTATLAVVKVINAYFLSPMLLVLLTEICFLLYQFEKTAFSIFRITLFIVCN